MMMIVVVVVVVVFVANIFLFTSVIISIVAVSMLINRR